MNFFAIDHSILSPSGRVSKRSRKDALRREHARLFDGIDISPKTQQPTEKERLLNHAKMLRDMAERGMKPRAYKKKADELEAQAAALSRDK